MDSVQLPGWAPLKSSAQQSIIRSINRKTEKRVINARPLCVLYVYYMMPVCAEQSKRREQ